VRETARLVLRRWRPDDVATLARWQADPVLMRHIGRTYEAAETEEALARYEAHWDEHGFGLWAAEEKTSGALVGRVGLSYHRLWPDDPEVGWLIDTAWQGRGLATEAGAESLRCAFDELGFERVVSICTPENLASRAVMAKLGLRRFTRIFDPQLAIELVIHRIDRAAFDTSRRIVGA
jgi:RimJ/RimL family protein N-acetyltransferase